jgi:hypothetical protein
VPGVAPALSVVVAAWTDAASLGRCLASLRGQESAPALEVIVARNFHAGAGAALQQLPGVIDISMRSETTVPVLRAAGLRRARGEVVAFIEDHAACARGWAEALVRAHRGPDAAIGGPVEQADDAGALDWAVYFYDYGRYMPPCQAGRVEQLSGLNMSFKRSALDGARATERDGVLEAEIQASLRAGGQSLLLEPGAMVVHDRHHSGSEAVGRAFHLARGYAAGRLAGKGGLVRAAYAAAALTLPVLLLGRIGAGVLRKRRHARQLLQALPWLAVLVVAWSAGECAGYVAGAGSSAGRWR